MTENEIKEYNRIVDYIENNTETGQTTIPFVLGWIRGAIKLEKMTYEEAFNILHELIIETDLVKQ